MSVLPAQHIRRRALDEKMIEPFAERGEFKGKTYGLGPATYDLRCQQNLNLMPNHLTLVYLVYRLIDWVLVKLGRPTRYQDYKLGFALVSSLECVRMPNDVCATVMDKSSWARKGMAVQNTYFDPGFIGFPTFELTNHSHSILRIEAGMSICQFKFEQLIEATEIPYKGKYQNQPAMPVEAKTGVDIWGVMP